MDAATFSTWNPFASNIDAGAPGPRMGRAALSFALVVAAYWVYAVVGVRLIEPAADPEAATTTKTEPLPPDSRQPYLEALFSAGSWQVKTPKILENGRTMLLFQDYQNRGNGQVELHPCALVYSPDGVNDVEQRARQAIVLEAPDGAVLQFDKPLRLGGGEVGKLTAGQMAGAVTIRSDGKSPGPEDDLRISTSNVQLSQQHVWTLSPVDFRLGPSYGRGHEMHIHLLPAPQSGSSDSPAPAFGGLESFEMRRIEQLHLEPSKAHAPPPPGQAAGPVHALSNSDLPLEIACRGPFRFQMGKRIATFEDQVDVLRIHPNGPGDKLSCDVLTIHFVDKRDVPGKDGKPPLAAADRPPLALTDLEARSLEAVGEPAVLTVPSQQADGRGQHLEYDLATGWVYASSEQEVVLRQLPSEIHARAVKYQPTTDGRLARIQAKGPGWLRGVQAEKPGQPHDPKSLPQQLEARWTEELLVVPQDQKQVIKLTGGAGLKFSQGGQLDADNIYFWLNELPPAPGQATSKLQPELMLASGNARIESEQLTGVFHEVEVWFLQPGDPRTLDDLPRAIAPRTALERFGPRNVQLTMLQVPYGEGPPPTALAAAGMSPVPSMPAAANAPPDAPAKQHYRASGTLLRALVVLHDGALGGSGTPGNGPPAEPPPPADANPAAPGPPRPSQADISELWIEEHAQLIETKTQRPDDKPMIVTGDRIRSVGPQQPTGTVTITGQVAHFEARGLALTSTNINLNRGTNRLWSDGAGRMELPMQRDLDGHPQAAGGVLELTWRNGMNFDGLRARFEDSVVASTPQSTLRTEWLEVLFRQAIRFSQVTAQGNPTSAQGDRQQPEVDQVLCRGGVWMENRRMQGNELAALENMQAADLSFNHTSGALVAQGPGWLTRTWLGNDDQVADFSGAPPAQRRPAAGNTAAANRLQSLVVKFQGPLSGNTFRREFIFHDEVQAAFAPVESWDARLDPRQPNLFQPDTLGPNGVALNCNQLRVVEMPTPLDGQKSMELEALGNAVVEARTYTGKAMRIAYAQAKGLLILEGDGRSDADLYRQDQIGGPLTHIPAQRIYFWPRTKQTRIDNARALEMTDFPDPRHGMR